MNSIFSRRMQIGILNANETLTEMAEKVEFYKMTNTLAAFKDVFFTLLYVN